MRSKTLNTVLLVFAVALNAVILAFVDDPWGRLGFGVWLLLVIIVLASQLELGVPFGYVPRVAQRPRRFVLLRASVTALLAEVRRLNWLVVDLDRGFRNRETVTVEIAASEAHLRELLKEIRKNAGKTDDPFTPGSDVRPPSTPDVQAEEAGEGAPTG